MQKGPTRQRGAVVKSGSFGLPKSKDERGGWDARHVNRGQVDAWKPGVREKKTIHRRPSL